MKNNNYITKGRRISTMEIRIGEQLMRGQCIKNINFMLNDNNTLLRKQSRAI